MKLQSTIIMQGNPSETKEGLWNNSWVKNLPVRPLDSQEENPGPAEPLNLRPPGLGQKKTGKL